ncbi:class I SAM-dependent methyltransferase [Dyella subtropica]|uniref:class I SAM-dependent methyltransferase n=1 Tax=Dyella subtropica TaxID=2992127 RepID=UPI00224EF0C7|nr:class I SAM-dependent methyltransferase [Dyella subtropica]
MLGDTPQRDYAEKLKMFNAFARPELCEAIDALAVPAGSRVLDAGCGTGEAVAWFHQSIQGRAMVVGMDLATAHIHIARRTAPTGAPILQADMMRPPLADGSFDLVWAVNAINHLSDPVAGVRVLSNLLRPGGRLVIGQSSLLPDMYFAWDSRLERIVNEAVRQYYRERYGRSEHDLAAIRSLVGWLQTAELRQVSVRTRMIERTHPLTEADERYLLHVIFRGTWGERLRPYLRREDFEALARLCDPDDACYALRRPDFHFLQSLTIAVATK